MFKISNDKIITFFILSFLVGLGFLLRYPNLGKLCLSVDEPIHAMIIKNIHSIYLPISDSGFLYLRGILFNYTLAFITWFTQINEFYLRIPNVILGLAEIILIYFIGKEIIDRKIGILSSLLMTFSVWEIEFSRHVRMYIPFQFFGMLSIFLFYKGFIKGKKNFIILSFFSYILMITFHQLSIFWIPVILLPLIMGKFEKKSIIIVFLVLTLIFYFFWYYILDKVIWTFFKSDFYQNKILIGEKNNLVKIEDKEKSVKMETNQLINLINFPNLKLFRYILYNYPAVWTVSLFMFFLFLVSFMKIIKLSNYSNGLFILMLLMLLSLLFHQISLAGLFFILGCIYIIKNKINISTIKFFLVPLILNLIYWMIVGVLFSQWANNYLPGYSILAKLVIVLFNFPKFRYILYWFMNGWTQIFIFSMFLLIYSLLRYYFKKDNQGEFFISSVVLIQILSFTILAPTNFMPRYLFYFFPFMLLLYAVILFKLTNFFTMFILKFFHIISKKIYRSSFVALQCIFLIVAIFLTNSEFNILSAISIHKRDYSTIIRQNYRMPGGSSFNTYKKPIDFFSCSKYIKERLKPDDIVICQKLGAIYSLKYYIGRLDYRIYRPKIYIKKHENGNLSNHITSTIYIRSVELFKELVDKGKEGSSTWIFLWEPSEEFKKEICNRYIRDHYPDRLVYTGLDENSKVYKIEH